LFFAFEEADLVEQAWSVIGKNAEIISSIKRRMPLRVVAFGFSCHPSDIDSFGINRPKHFGMANYVPAPVLFSSPACFVLFSNFSLIIFWRLPEKPCVSEQANLM
jgi:hypothetical protein